MKKINSLVKYYFKNFINDTFGVNKKISTAFMVICMLLGILVISIPLAAVVFHIYNPLKSLGIESTIILLLLSIDISILFLFGVYTTINIFYFSNDIEEILPLPFRGYEIVLSKFISVYINMIMYSCILVLPLIIYGILESMGCYYYLYMVIILLITAIIPMAVTSIITSILMRFVNISKHKEMLKIVSIVFSFIIVIAITFISQSKNTDSNILLNIIINRDQSSISKLSGIIITNKYSMLALTNNDNIKGIVSLLISIMISISIFILCYVVISKIYLGSILGYSETFVQKEKNKKRGFREVKENSQLKALVYKDLRLIFRTPQLFMNCVAILLYVPILLILLILSNNISGLSEIINNNEKLVIVSIYLITVLLISIGNVSITSISREGKDILVSKYIPVPYKVFLYSKIITSMCINSLGVLIIVMLLNMLKVRFSIIFLGVIVTIATTVCISLYGLFLDFKVNSKIYEENKTKLTNTYMQVIILSSMLMLGGVILFLALKFISDIVIISTIIFLVCVGMSYYFYIELKELAKEIYN